MKSVKWKKHYRSKYQFPTRIITKALIHGFKSAKKHLEESLKRPLHKDTKIVTRGGNWVFMEPINEV